MHLIIHTDGGARGNPGAAGIGVVIENDDGYILEEHAKYLGRTTNNQAEYHAAILGLKRAIELKASSVEIVTDSELLVKQAKGEYRVKDPDLSARLQELKALEIELGEPVNYRHIRRELNKRADDLANKAMDQGTGKLSKS